MNKLNGDGTVPWILSIVVRKGKADAAGKGSELLFSKSRLLKSCKRRRFFANEKITVKSRPNRPFDAGHGAGNSVRGDC